jgi:xanthine/uracil permease
VYFQSKSTEQTIPAAVNNHAYVVVFGFVSSIALRTASEGNCADAEELLVLIKKFLSFRSGLKKKY